MSNAMHWRASSRAALLGLAVLVLPHLAAAALTEDERNTIAVFRESSRGVVHIKTSSPEPAAATDEAKRDGVGTGFVIDDLGHVLTANHVVDGYPRIVVVLSDGYSTPARVVGTSPEFDMALLRIDDGGHPLFPLRLGDSSELAVGQKVMAIGNGLNLHNSLSVGVVSALGRTLRRAPTALEAAFIQTDAAINPGNSGGPLLNSDGDVIGINDALVSNAQSIGFAIPIELVRNILPDLLQMGHVYKPRLGFSGTMVRGNFSGTCTQGQAAGFLVQEVLENTPAARAGLRAAPHDAATTRQVQSDGGDVIVAINGECVTSAGGIQRAMVKYGPGQVLLRVYREARYIDLKLVLPAMTMSPQPTENR